MQSDAGDLAFVIGLSINALIALHLLYSSSYD